MGLRFIWGWVNSPFFVLYQILNGAGVEFVGKLLSESQKVTLLRQVRMNSNAHSPLWRPKAVELDKVGEFIEDVLVESVAQMVLLL